MGRGEGYERDRGEGLEGGAGRGGVVHSPRAEGGERGTEGVRGS